MCKKLFLEISQNSQENTCAKISFLIKLQVSALQLYSKKRPWHQACNFIEKETLARVFYCEFCEIFKDSFFYRTPPLAASVHMNLCSH